MTRCLTPLVLVLAVISLCYAQFAEPYPYCEVSDASYTPPNSACEKALIGDVGDVRAPGFTIFNPLNDHDCAASKPIYSDGCAQAYADFYCLTYCSGQSLYNPVPTRDICDRISQHCDPCIKKLTAINPDACGSDAPTSYNITIPTAPSKGVYFRYDTFLSPTSRFLPSNQGGSMSSVERPCTNLLASFGISMLLGIFVIW